MFFADAHFLFFPFYIHIYLFILIVFDQTVIIDMIYLQIYLESWHLVYKPRRGLMGNLGKLTLSYLTTIHVHVQMAKGSGIVLVCVCNVCIWLIFFSPCICVYFFDIHCIFKYDRIYIFNLAYIYIIQDQWMMCIATSWFSWVKMQRSWMWGQLSRWLIGLMRVTLKRLLTWL